MKKSEPPQERQASSAGYSVSKHGRAAQSAVRVAIGVAGAAVLAVACATTGVEPQNDRLVAMLENYEETGETRACLSIPTIRSIKGVNERKLLVRIGIDDYWVTTPNGKCNGITRVNNRIEYSTTLTQLCQNDILRIVDNLTGQFAGGCGVGKFRKLREKPPVDPEEEASEHGGGETEAGGGA